jgi:hypothetical protein
MLKSRFPMRYIHDAPRALPELLSALSVEDGLAVIAFAGVLGHPLTRDTEPETVEAIYAAWCADPNAVTVPALS